jgi:hypothetical protein
MTEEHLKSNYGIRLAPAIYQEYIPGYSHIRAHCFGDSVYFVLIDSKGLDWREDLDVPFRIIDLDINLKTSIINVVKSLSLKMGIIDLKLLKDSSPIWLEINPQGQFLFVEGLSDLNLTSYFCEFLYSEAACVLHVSDNSCSRTYSLLLYTRIISRNELFHFHNSDRSADLLGSYTSEFLHAN